MRIKTVCLCVCICALPIYREHNENMPAIFALISKVFKLIKSFSKNLLFKRYSFINFVYLSYS